MSQQTVGILTNSKNALLVRGPPRAEIVDPDFPHG